MHLEPPKLTPTRKWPSSSGKLPRQHRAPIPFSVTARGLSIPTSTCHINDQSFEPSDQHGNGLIFLEPSNREDYCYCKYLRRQQPCAACPELAQGRHAVAQPAVVAPAPGVQLPFRRDGTFSICSSALNVHHVLPACFPEGRITARLLKRPVETKGTNVNAPSSSLQLTPRNKLSEH